METLHGKNYFSTAEVAKILHVTRVTVFRWIKEGTCTAQKVGRGYIISHDELMKHVTAKPLSEDDKVEINKLVDKVIADYGETIRMLGRE